jgi:hypothetical protein
MSVVNHCPWVSSCVSPCACCDGSALVCVQVLCVCCASSPRDRYCARPCASLRASVCVSPLQCPAKDQANTAHCGHRTLAVLSGQMLTLSNVRWLGCNSSSQCGGSCGRRACRGACGLCGAMARWRARRKGADLGARRHPVASCRARWECWWRMLRTSVVHRGGIGAGYI